MTEPGRETARPRGLPVAPPARRREDPPRLAARTRHVEPALRDAQAETLLRRVVALVWISMVMMPLAIWSYVALAAPERLRTAITVTLAAMVCVLLLRALVKAGVFARHPHLALFLLVGGVFGPVASTITQLTEATGSGSFFFSYFLIFLATTTLFPADARGMVAVGLALCASYAVGVVVGGARARLLDNSVYLGTMTVLSVLLSQIVGRSFFDERRARLELHATRDALFSEMEVAQGIQTLLLPQRPELPGYVVGGIMIPADEVGGDYFDVIDAGGRRFLAIGDVSGHGVTTGLTMMMARASLIGCLEADGRAPLPVLYAALNRALRRNLERMELKLYMTFALLEDLGEGRFAAVGGHLPAMIWRKTRGVVDEIELAGVWLGIMPELPPETNVETLIELGRGDVMLLYTDGAVERFGGSDEMFGPARLRDSLAQAAPGGAVRVIERIMTDLERHSPRQEDDVTLLAVHRIGEPTAPPS